MTTNLRQISFLIAIFTVSVSLWAAGPESGGGGGVVSVNGRLHLVDFYTIQGSAEILSQSYLNFSASEYKTPFILNIQSQSETSNDYAFKLAPEIFKKWSDLPYDTIGFLINTALYSPVKWNITDEKVMAHSLYRPVELPSELQPITAAYYTMKNQTYQVNIARPVWNQLAIHDQAGLIIHEALRHIQIGVSMRFDDEALQKATAMMMTCKPRIKLDQYLFYLLHNRRDIAEERFEKFADLTKECWK